MQRRQQFRPASLLIVSNKTEANIAKIFQKNLSKIYPEPEKTNQSIPKIKNAY